MKKIVLVALALVIVTTTFSQKRDARQQKNIERQERVKRMIAQEEEGAILFSRQTVFGIKLNTDGYGMFMELGRMKTARKANLYNLEIGERKHPKEERIPSIRATFSNPYIYGKRNNFYYTKLGFAQQRLIGNKGNKNGVAISAIAGGGLTLGLLKPYYIKVEDPSTGEIKDVKYDDNNDSVFLNPNAIIGATGFSKGFGEIKVTPGVYGKAALRFDYGRYNELVSAIEVGINVESYIKKMPHMIDNKNRQVYFNAYAAIEFGRRK